MEFVWGKDDLNGEQGDAITHQGSVYLVACPGSGKTRALTYKAALELSRLTSFRHRVLAITYTHRAAEEIAERIERLGINTEQLWIGTIHSFCLEWILRPYAIYHTKLRQGFRVIDQHERDRRLEKLGQASIPRLGLPALNHYYTAAGCQLDTAANGRQHSVMAVLNSYWAQLEAERLIDFELILKYAHDLITSQPTIATLLGSIFKFVLVDEFQDTKEIQYTILAAILRGAKGKAQALLVGDPNQAIYGSLGGYAMSRVDFAALSGLDMVEKSLSINYRSSDRVVAYFSNYHVAPVVITAEGEHKTYDSLVSFDEDTAHRELDDEIVRLIQFNIQERGIKPHEICIVGPQWTHLASLTRRLMGALPEYSFDGPGMAPFARDQENFWYKVARLALTEPSPQLFVRRTRWAAEILADLHHGGVSVGAVTPRELLRACNSIKITEEDGLEYLRLFFDDFSLALKFERDDYPALDEHHEAFFAKSEHRLELLERAGVQGVSTIAMFRRVFGERRGITISTIHGVKGGEFDTLIGFALLEGMVPHFADPAPETSAKKLLYVVCSRPRKNLHLIAETGRVNGRGDAYETTEILSACEFTYDVVPDP